MERTGIEPVTSGLQSCAKAPGCAAACRWSGSGSQAAR